MKKITKGIDCLIALGFGVLAAIINFPAMADYAYPGVGAKLMTIWRGLDIAVDDTHPLMSVFASFFGAGNHIAPICGVLSAMLVYLIVTAFARVRIHGEHTAEDAVVISRIAGAVSTLVFMFTPAVRAAATHLEPRLFEFTWALMAFGVLALMPRLPNFAAVLMPAVAAVMVGFGLCDSALFVALLPLYILAIAVSQSMRKRKPYLATTAFVLIAIIAFLMAVRCFDADLIKTMKFISKEFIEYFTVPGWLFIVIFSTIPFVVSIFSSTQAYNTKPTLVQWIFHISMSLVVIIAVATPFSPSSQMEPYGILPVASSAFAAVLAGYVISFWWIHRKSWLGIATGCVVSFVLFVTIIGNLFSFNGDDGEFADKVARKVIEELDGRTWLVTDGTLDDHIRLQAKEMGKEVNIVSLDRDLDTEYLEKLSEIVEKKGVGGSKNESLRMSLMLGVLPFVQDWFAADPSVAKDVAIYGAPDLWFSAGLKPVPELLFFGADPKRVPDWSVWSKELAGLLEAPEGWGSYKARYEKNPLVRMRNSIRRHLGFVANNRGVYLQDQKKDEDAFAMYEMVLNEIDTDNVCSLFNEIEMAGAKYAKALAKKRELERKLKVIVDDKDRRYQIWRLGNYYGYIRNPEIFVRLGYTWARSGRPGDALSHIRRAIDFVPTDKRIMLLNMMAALYASDNDKKKSRRIYETVLKQNANDHDALVGMMRLELLDGNSEKALEYLQRASKIAGNTRQANIELAMVAMMKNDHTMAKDMLKKVTDNDPRDMQAWSLLAAVTMQQADAAKDKKGKEKLMKELETLILPQMEKQARGPFDYYVQATKAFLLLRKGEDKRREARDAFAAAARARPDITATHDMVLGLDISLDDKVEAERHARMALRRNRNAPLANYVMGSLALGKGEFREAELYLRKAADAEKPVPLALNDLAEVLRRNRNYDEAEKYARLAVKAAPKLYVAWETLGSILLGADRNLKEAEECIKKACELSKGENGVNEDVRMLVSLARVQLKTGDVQRAKGTIRKVQNRINELSDFERSEFEDMRKGVK